MKKLRFFLCWILVMGLVVAFISPSAFAQVEEVIDTNEKRDVVLYRGDLVALKVYSLTRIAISTPGIVDIVNADVDEILLVGKSLGQTQIFIWDEYGKRSILARVMEQDLEMVKARIEQLLAFAEIKGITLVHSAYEGKLIATGKVNKVQKEEFDEVITDFGSFIINMVKTQGDLIQIDAQIVELTEGWAKEFGVKWENLNSWVFSKSAGKFQDAFRFGTYNAAGNEITATINALISENKARTLSRPSIVVSDGEKASVNVGGEVPVSVPTITPEGTTYAVEYKTYGVQLSATPKIMDDDKIDITLKVTISSQGALIESGGANNYEFTTTTMQTRVLLDDGQTIIIAGLIQKAEVDAIEKVPFLNRIPIIGPLLFTHTRRERTPNKEIVITLTPYLRRQSNKLKTNQELQEEQALKEKVLVEAGGFSVELDEDGLLVKKLEDMEELEVQEDLMVEFLEEKVLEQKEVRLDDVLADIEAAVSRAAELNVEEDISSEITEYAKLIQSRIASRISFPFRAKEEGWEGTVMLSLTILSEGTLRDVDVKESSGYNIFDKDAVNTAEIAAPYDDFPVEMEMDEVIILIPVMYNQEAFLIND